MTKEPTAWSMSDAEFAEALKNKAWRASVPAASKETGDEAAATQRRRVLAMTPSEFEAALRNKLWRGC
jgi:hypothetical protein